MSKGKRPRAQRRLDERGAQKQARDRDRMAKSLPGGAPEHPITVPTPAVIETRAAADPCPLCGGALDVLEHAAVREEDEALRRVDCRCRLCHKTRHIWFRLSPDLPS